MKPDITIFNAAIMRPVIVAHTPAEQSLLARHYGAAGVDWVCVERTGTEENRKFRKLHEEIAASRIVVRNDQASEGRLRQLTSGGYSATGRTRPNPRVAWGRRLTPENGDGRDDPVGIGRPLHGQGPGGRPLAGRTQHADEEGEG